MHSLVSNALLFPADSETQQQVGVETEESSKAMAPKFVKGPGDQVVQEGRMVRFDCRASGRPYPEVSLVCLLANTHIKWSEWFLQKTIYQIANYGFQ